MARWILAGVCILVLTGWIIVRLYDPYPYCIENCEAEQPDPTRYQALFWVAVDGTSMPVLVSGKADSRTVLLTVVGGPGGSSITLERSFYKDDLEDDLLVAYWDQRMSGFSTNDTVPERVTVARWSADLQRVTQEIRARFPDRLIVLHGQSFGGYVVSHFITHPDNRHLYDGWIIVNGGTTKGSDVEVAQRNGLISRAKGKVATGEIEWRDTLAWMQAHPLNPDVYNETLANSYEKILGSSLWPDEEAPVTIPKALKTHTPVFFDERDMQRFIENAEHPIHSTYARNVYELDRDHLLGNIHAPGLLIWGGADWTMPIEVAERFTKKLSDQVQLVTYPNEGHTPQFGVHGRLRHSAYVKRYIADL